jgi:hypothetical protein
VGLAGKEKKIERTARGRILGIEEKSVSENGKGNTE